jgi:hypothetical protein
MKHFTFFQVILMGWLLISCGGDLQRSKVLSPRRDNSQNKPMSQLEKTLWNSNAHIAASLSMLGDLSWVYELSTRESRLYQDSLCPKVNTLSLKENEDVYQILWSPARCALGRGSARISLDGEQILTLNKDSHGQVNVITLEHKTTRWSFTNRNAKRVTLSLQGDILLDRLSPEEWSFKQDLKMQYTNEVINPNVIQARSWSLLNRGRIEDKGQWTFRDLTVELKYLRAQRVGQGKWSNQDWAELDMISQESLKLGDCDGLEGQVKVLRYEGEALKDKVPAEGDIVLREDTLTNNMINTELQWPACSAVNFPSSAQKFPTFVRWLDPETQRELPR